MHPVGNAFIESRRILARASTHGNLTLGAGRRCSKPVDSAKVYVRTRFAVGELPHCLDRIYFSGSSCGYVAGKGGNTEKH